MKKGVIFLLMFLLAVFSVSAIYCGDGVLDEGEICDVGKLSHYTCLNFSYDGGDLGCLDDCSDYDYGECFGDDICGNGIVDSDELCDSDNIRGRTCEDEGYGSGTLSCSVDCNSYDISECTEINKTVDLNSTGEINETIELNLTEENLTETLDLEDLNVDNEVVDVPSGVVGVASSESKVITLGVWLIIIISLLVIGVFFIWLYIFKLKK